MFCEFQFESENRQYVYVDISGVSTALQLIIKLHILKTNQRLNQKKNGMLTLKCRWF